MTTLSEEVCKMNEYARMAMTPVYVGPVTIYPAMKNATPLNYHFRFAPDMDGDNRDGRQTFDVRELVGRATCGCAEPEFPKDIFDERQAAIYRDNRMIWLTAVFNDSMAQLMSLAAMDLGKAWKDLA